jgi:predicted dehydrogenase
MPVTRRTLLATATAAAVSHRLILAGNPAGVVARAAAAADADRHVDYRRVLDDPRIDVVLIGAPDHWHTKMLIDAVQAGKDVYCEKPLTLTIDEGKAIHRAVAATGRIVQVGSWQRSDHRFRQAVEMVRQGRIGKLETVEVVLGKNQVGGPFPSRPVPANLDWKLWQGQTPDVPYVPERSHYTFRWWLDYSGGQLTDWGAHNIDIPAHRRPPDGDAHGLLRRQLPQGRLGARGDLSRRRRARVARPRDEGPAATGVTRERHD